MSELTSHNTGHVDNKLVIFIVWPLTADLKEMTGSQRPGLNRPQHPPNLDRLPQLKCYVRQSKLVRPCIIARVWLYPKQLWGAHKMKL